MYRVCLAVALLVTIAGGSITLAPAQERQTAATTPLPAAAPVIKHTDLAYYNGPDADRERHSLDLYLPKSRKHFPVLMFVHGGTWRSGSKRQYVAVGQSFARSGIGMVIINYRLSPQVRHPAHIQDVARAFAWTRTHIAKYGGDPARLFLFGHSAGGHLVSLLATDPEYLKAEKQIPSNIRGVISVSGVYSISPTFPVFRPIFGTDVTACRDASPLCHVTGHHAPFLIAYGDKDFAQLDTMAIDMNAALEKCQSPTKILKLEGRNHYTIITSVIEDTDPIHVAIRDFVTTVSSK